MAEANPLLAMADRLMAWVNRRLSEHVRLVRVGTTPAEAADGWAIAVGAQRVALGGTVADTGWLTVARPVGVEGDPRRRVKSGVLYLRGGVGRLDAWPALTTIVTLPVGSRPQSDVVADALTLNGVRVGTWTLNSAGQLRLAITAQPGINTTVALTLPPAPVD